MGDGPPTLYGWARGRAAIGGMLEASDDLVEADDLLRGPADVARAHGRDEHMLARHRDLRITSEQSPGSWAC